MKTDRELLELAAKAADLQEWGWMADALTHVVNNQFVFWNPLTDDGDALRLAVKLRLRVEWWKNGVEVSHPDLPPSVIHSTEYDEYAATRRAIVESAAAIGESL